MTVPNPPRNRVTYANVASTLALALAVGGGTAYAAGLVDTTTSRRVLSPRPGLGRLRLLSH